MSWQTAICLQLVFGALTALYQRKISKKFVSHAQVALAHNYLFFISPLGIIYALFNYHIELHLTPFIFLMLVLGGILFAVNSITAYQANSHIEAGQFTVITNIYAVFTVIIAGLVLNEKITSNEIIGLVLILFSVVLVAARKTYTETFVISKWTFWAIFSSLFLALAFITEKYLLTNMNVGTYMIFGWGFQTLAKLAFAFNTRHKLKDFDKKDHIDLAVMGLLRALQGIMFVIALSQVDVGLIASITSYKVILVFIGALVFLHEREHIYRRLGGSIIATIGLILLFS